MFTVPFGSELNVSVNGVAAPAIVSVSGPLVVCCGLLLSVAFTMRLAVVATVGVPLTTQPLSMSPAGSVPLVKTQV